MKKALLQLLACLVVFASASSHLTAQNFFDDFESGEISSEYTLINGDGLIPALVADSSWRDTAWIASTSGSFDGYAALSISWYTDAAGNDIGPCDDWLILPKLTLGADAKLSFDAKSATSSGGFPDDYWVLINPGEPTIESFEEDGLILLQINNETHTQFITREIDLSAYEGQSVHLAFRNVTNADGYGLWIDNISVTSTSSVQQVNADFFNMKVLPNPVREVARLRYSLLESAQVEILLQDVFGRTVASVQRSNHLSGNYDIALPVETLTNGTYLVTLRTTDKVAATRLIIAR